MKQQWQRIIAGQRQNEHPSTSPNARASMIDVGVRDEDAMTSSMMSVAGNYDNGARQFDQERIYVKVSHNDTFKRVSQLVSNAELADLQYKILVAFDYIQEQSNINQSAAQASKAIQEQKDEMQRIFGANWDALSPAQKEHQEQQMKRMLEKERMYKDLRNFNIDLVVSTKTEAQMRAKQIVMQRRLQCNSQQHSDGDLLILRTQEDYDHLVAAICQATRDEQIAKQRQSNFFQRLIHPHGNQNNQSGNRLIITALISHNLSAIGLEDHEVHNEQETVKKELAPKQEKSSLLFDKDDDEEEDKKGSIEEEEKQLVKSELVIEEATPDKNVQLIEVDDLDKKELPTLVGKSSSLVPEEKFTNLHPRMIYEILKHVQQNGSINASQMIDVLESFGDMNTRAEVEMCTKDDYVKYANYGLDVVKETIAKQQKNKYALQKDLADSLRPSDATDTIRRDHAVSSEAVLKNNVNPFDLAQSQLIPRETNATVDILDDESMRKSSVDVTSSNLMLSERSKSQSKLDRIKLMRERIRQSVADQKLQISVNLMDKKEVEQANELKEKDDPFADLALSKSIYESTVPK